MLTIINQTYKFVKEPTGRWYIDLPEYEGMHADLEMVEGADTMLEYVGKGNHLVYLQLSEQPFAEASELTLLHDYSEQSGGGGIYLLEEYRIKPKSWGKSFLRVDILEPKQEECSISNAS
jgi:hypothetical protein